MIGDAGVPPGSIQADTTHGSSDHDSLYVRLCAGSPLPTQLRDRARPHVDSGWASKNRATVQKGGAMETAIRLRGRPSGPAVRNSLARSGRRAVLSRLITWANAARMMRLPAR